MTSSLIDEQAIAGANAPQAAVGSIYSQHPWHAYMSNDTRWGKLRAIMDGMEDEEVKKKYLPRAKFELIANWEVRVKLSQFLGLSEDALEQLIGAVMGQEPTFEVDPSLDEFLANVDGSGTTLQEFTENIVRESAGMGICFVRVDGPAGVPMGRTRKDDLEAGLNKAFATILKAEEVIDWDFEEASGELAWVKVRSVVSRQGGPMEERKLYEQITLYDAVRVDRWQREMESGLVQSEEKWVSVPLPFPLHNLGMVPIVPFYGRRISMMRGESLLKGAARADIAQFAEESSSAMARYRHANPLLKLFSERDVQQVFSGNVVRLVKNGQVEEDMEYVELNSTSFDVREQAIERYRRTAVSKAGVNPQQVADSAGSTTGESGIAQRVRFTQTQKRHIDTFSRKLEAGLERVLDLAEKWLTNPMEPTEKSIRVRSSFEVMEADDLIRRLERVEGLIQSPTLIRELTKQTAKALIGDVSEEATKKIMDEIDAAPIKAQPDEMNFGA